MMPRHTTCRRINRTHALYALQPKFELVCVVQNWIEDLSGHVKSLDQNHLVLLGHAGVFGASTPDKCALLTRH